MYADDMVHFSVSQEGLQHMLNTLSEYSAAWKLNVNTSKTIIVVFRNRGKLQRTDVWLYNNEVLDIVDEFNYLGMMFNYNGKFSITQKHASEQGRKALFSICASLKNHSTQCAVFDTYVTSVYLYASEIWGWHKSGDVEKVHVNFCRKV